MIDALHTLTGLVLIQPHQVDSAISPILLLRKLMYSGVNTLTSVTMFLSDGVGIQAYGVNLQTTVLSIILLSLLVVATNF